MSSPIGSRHGRRGSLLSVLIAVAASGACGDDAVARNDDGGTTTDAGADAGAGTSTDGGGPAIDGGTPLSPDWYVDNRATGANDGRSWADAWQSLGDIDWASIAPGDTIVVSGGPSGLTYAETLTVEASGEEGAPIVVAASDEPGHDGAVTVDCEDARDNGLVVRARRYVIVSGLHLPNCLRNGAFVSGASGSTYAADGASSQVILENLTVFANHGRGVFVQTSDHVTVRGCHITTPTFVNAQTDGIYSQRNHDNVYEDNYIVIYNEEPTGHDDCIQLFEDTSTTVRGNFLAQVNEKRGNAQGLYATTMHGVTRYYNNVVDLNAAQSNGLAFRRLDGTGTVEIYGNTVYSDRAFNTAEVTETPDPVIKNNVFFTRDAQVALTLTGWAGDPSNIDYNLIWSASSDQVVSFDGASSTWAEHQARGFDAHGVHADPRVTDVEGDDFGLQPGSPAIDVGLSLGPPFDRDKDGVTRPQGAGWDLGAHEFVP